MLKYKAHNLKMKEKVTNYTRNRQQIKSENERL